MLKVGLTGGIGSGKSIVAQFLEVLQIPVYYADTRAKLLMNSNLELVKQIKKVFGNDVYDHGQLNRAYLAQKVFNDKNLLTKLNQLVHPCVKNDFESWCSKNVNSGLVVQEAAILFENGSYKNFDHMVLVTAPLARRIDRVMKRDGVSYDQVYERINNQWDDIEKIKLANTVIINDDNHSLIDQTLKLLNKL